MTHEFHIPTRPYGLIAAINRRAAAIGSVGYAMACSGASYNGHHVSVSWNDYRRYYIAEHYWGERVVHCRSQNVADCIRAAVEEYDRGALGASVRVFVRDEDLAGVPADLLGRLTPGAEPQTALPWYSSWLEHALKTGTTHLLIEADKADGDKEAVYLARAFPRLHSAMNQGVVR